MNSSASRIIGTVTFLVLVSFGPILHGQVFPLLPGEFGISPANQTIGIGTNELIVVDAFGTTPVNSLTLAVLVFGSPIVSVTGLGDFDMVTPTFLDLPGFDPISSEQTVVATFNAGSLGVVDGESVAAIGLDTSGFSEGDIITFGFTTAVSQSFFSDTTSGTDFETFSVLTLGVEVVPEPSSAAFLFAISSLGLLRRRKFA